MINENIASINDKGCICRSDGGNHSVACPASTEYAKKRIEIVLAALPEVTEPITEVCLECGGRHKTHNNSRCSIYLAELAELTKKG